MRLKFDKMFFGICLKNNLKVVVAFPNGDHAWKVWDFPDVMC